MQRFKSAGLAAAVVWGLVGCAALALEQVLSPAAIDARLAGTRA